MPWFPDWHRASKDEVRAFDDARRALWENSDREERAGIHEETPEYLRLNTRVWETERPLSLWQRGVLAYDLREARRQMAERRAQRRERKGRSR